MFFSILFEHLPSQFILLRDPVPLNSSQLIISILQSSLVRPEPRISWRDQVQNIMMKVVKLPIIVIQHVLFIVILRLWLSLPYHKVLTSLCINSLEI